MVRISCLPANLRAAVVDGLCRDAAHEDDGKPVDGRLGQLSLGHLLGQDGIGENRPSLSARQAAPQLHEKNTSVGRQKSIIKETGQHQLRLRGTGGGSVVVGG